MSFFGKFMKNVFKPSGSSPNDNRVTRRSVGQTLIRDRDPLESWEIVKDIGDGAFGKVQLARRRDNNEIQAAVKIIELLEDDKLDEILVEIEILTECRHPNIVGLRETYFIVDHLWAFLEYCGAGALDSIMFELGHPLKEAQIQHVCRVTLDALTFLHDHFIIHRDLKAGNILVTADAEIKLADFGVSAKMRSASEKRDTFIGTPYWMAPEVMICETFKDNPYDSLADIWSLGITLIELAQMEPPNNDVSPMRVLIKIQKSDPPTLAQPRRWTPQFSAFLRRCLMKHPQSRPPAADLLTDPFVSNALPNAPIVELLSEYKGEVIDEIVDVNEDRQSRISADSEVNIDELGDSQLDFLPNRALSGADNHSSSSSGAPDLDDATTVVAIGPPGDAALSLAKELDELNAMAARRRVAPLPPASPISEETPSQLMSPITEEPVGDQQKKQLVPDESYRESAAEILDALDRDLDDNTHNSASPSAVKRLPDGPVDSLTPNAAVGAQGRLSDDNKENSPTVGYVLNALVEDVASQEEALTTVVSVGPFPPVVHNGAQNSRPLLSSSSVTRISTSLMASSMSDVTGSTSSSVYLSTSSNLGAVGLDSEPKTMVSLDQERNDHFVFDDCPSMAGPSRVDAVEGRAATIDRRPSTKVSSLRQMFEQRQASSESNSPKHSLTKSGSRKSSSSTPSPQLKLRNRFETPTATTTVVSHAGSGASPVVLRRSASPGFPGVDRPGTILNTKPDGSIPVMSRSMGETSVPTRPKEDRNSVMNLTQKFEEDRQRRSASGENTEPSGTPDSLRRSSAFADTKLTIETQLKQQAEKRKSLSPMPHDGSEPTDSPPLRSAQERLSGGRNQRAVSEEPTSPAKVYFGNFVPSPNPQARTAPLPAVSQQQHYSSHKQLQYRSDLIVVNADSGFSSVASSSNHSGKVSADPIPAILPTAAMAGNNRETRHNHWERQPLASTAAVAAHKSIVIHDDAIHSRAARPANLEADNAGFRSVGAMTKRSQQLQQQGSEDNAPPTPPVDYPPDVDSARIAGGSEVILPRAKLDGGIHKAPPVTQKQNGGVSQQHPAGGATPHSSLNGRYGDSTPAEVYSENGVGVVVSNGQVKRQHSIEGSSSVPSSKDETDNLKQRGGVTKEQGQFSRGQNRRRTMTKRTRVFMVDGVKMQTTTYHAMNADGMVENNDETKAKNKFLLIELKRLQRISQREHQEMKLREQMLKEHLEQRFRQETDNLAKTFNDTLMARQSAHKKYIEAEEKLMDEMRRQAEKKIRSEQVNELKSFRKHGEADFHLRKQELKQNGVTKDVYNLELRRMQEELKQQEIRFVQKQDQRMQKAMERINAEHRSKIALKEDQLLQEKHHMMRDHENKVWGLEEAHLLEQNEMEVECHKKKYHLERTLLVAMCSKELDALNGQNAEREDLYLKAMILDMKRLPKLLKEESKTRTMMMKESLKISERDKSHGTSEIAKKLKEFDEAEKRRIAVQMQKQQLKRERKLDEMRKAHEASLAELVYLQNEKKKVQLEHDAMKKEQIHQKQALEVQKWQASLGERRNVLEAQLLQEEGRQHQFYHAAMQDAANRSSSYIPHAAIAPESSTSF